MDKQHTGSGDLIIDEGSASPAPIPVTAPVVIDETEQPSAEPAPADPAIERNEDGTVTLRLAHPISVVYRKGGAEDRRETITQLRFRRATGADMRAVAALKGDAAGFALMARLSGVPVQVIDRIDGADLAKAGEIIADFLGVPPTGRR